ncbi:unnamed protein product [Lathyrus oleraceus]
MKVVTMIMRAHALKWWQWWPYLHPNLNWDTFTIVLLWHFKPEWRPILPIQDEEEEGVTDPNYKFAIRDKN